MITILNLPFWDVLNVDETQHDYHVLAEYHALLTAMCNESDMTMQAINEMAIRIVAETYYPHLMPVLTGGEIDESKRPQAFSNRSASNDTSG